MASGKAALDGKEKEFRTSFEILVADGERRLDSVAAALDDVSMQYRGRSEDRSYKQFIEALRLASTAARRRLRTIRDAYDSSPEEAYDSAHSLLQSFPAKHEKLVRALRPDRSEAMEVFAQPFTRLAKSLLSNVEVLFFSWAAEAYELRVYDPERAKDLTPGATVSLKREFGDDIQFLQFWHPGFREPAIFEHAVFGHELGHPAIRRRPPDSVCEALGSNVSDPTFSNVALDSAYEAHPEESGRLNTEEKTRLARWFDEIACDLIGMRLLGPAFAVAFVEVTAINRHFEPGQQPVDQKLYPPSSLRFEFLRKELEAYDLGDFEDRLRPILDRLTVTVPQAADPEMALPGSTAIVRSAVELFSEHCVPALLGSHGLGEELRDDLAGIWQLMEMEVPPAEKIVVGDTEPVADTDEPGRWSVDYDWRSILNGALLWSLDQLESVETQEQRAEITRKSVRVATGAIEMAEFQRRARVLRDQFSRMRIGAGR